MKFLPLKYTIDELKDKFNPIFQEFGLIKAYVFGKYARGEQKEGSRIDLLIKTDNLMELEVFYVFMRDLHHAVRVKVDVTFQEYLNPYIKDDIEKEAILLYSQL
jgi:predicted nucleotidyltransferase